MCAAVQVDVKKKTRPELSYLHGMTRLDLYKAERKQSSLS